VSLADDVEYMCQASLIGLQDFALTRLNHVDLLIKRRRALEDEIRKEQAAADVAQLLIDNWRLREALGSPPVQTSLPFEPRKEGKAEAA
jgi:hypothetical protein